MKARSAACALCSLALLSGAFGVTWTGPSAFAGGPIVIDDVTHVPAVGALTIAPNSLAPVDQTNGFKVTGATFTYVTAPQEAGDTFHLLWEVVRPFYNPAPISWINTGILNGSLTYTSGIEVGWIEMVTDTTNTRFGGQMSRVDVNGGLFVPGVTNPFNASASGAPASQPAGADTLIQEFSLQFRTVAGNESIALDLPNSAESIAPEPSSVAALAFGVLGAVGIVRRRRSA